MISKILNYHPFKPYSSTSDGFRYNLHGNWLLDAQQPRVLYFYTYLVLYIIIIELEMIRPVKTKIVHLVPIWFYLYKKYIKFITLK